MKKVIKNCAVGEDESHSKTMRPCVADGQTHSFEVSHNGGKK